jgi:hypothetical protein
VVKAQLKIPAWNVSGVNEKMTYMSAQSVSRPRYNADKVTTWIDCGLFEC